MLRRLRQLGLSCLSVFFEEGRRFFFKPILSRFNDGVLLVVSESQVYGRCPQLWLTRLFLRRSKWIVNWCISQSGIIVLLSHSVLLDIIQPFFWVLLGNLITQEVLLQEYSWILYLFDRVSINRYIDRMLWRSVIWDVGLPPRSLPIGDHWQRLATLAQFHAHIIEI